MAVTKYSRQRECIMDCLRSRCDHPTAEMIYRDVQEQFPNISLGTVYRNLALLTEHGEIAKLDCGENGVRYDACTHPHYHFVCRQCHRVMDLKMPAMDHIDILAASSFDGQIDGHFAYFYGLCSDCKKQH